MAFEIPKNLIHKVQALLRKESGLSSSYDHHDPSIHPLPSLDASIPELDKFMPENPRCKKCDAKFLRGTHSLICIYCGSKIQIQDNFPDPISFNSSFGCQWLLHSLDLNQSESVGSCNENFVLNLNKGHRPKKHEISLHDLLDFRIALSDESEKPKTSVTNKALEQSRSLNLTGAYLGNIFSNSPLYIVHFKEPVTEQIESIQCQTFVGEEKHASLSSISTGESVRTPENNDFKVSRQDENFNGSVGMKDNIAQRHSDVAECVDNNQCQVNNNSAPDDSTIDRHEKSLD